MQLVVVVVLLLLLLLLLNSLAVLLKMVPAEGMQAGALLARAEPQALRSMPG